MPQFDEDGLVVPRKPFNPCIDSTERRSIHKEILWNKKIGKNVLEKKNELEIVLAKRKDDKKKKELEAEKLTRRSSLERILDKQKMKIQEDERQRHEDSSSPDSSSPTRQSPSQQPQSEFLQVFTKFTQKSASSSDSTTTTTTTTTNNNNNNVTINNANNKNTAAIIKSSETIKPIPKSSQ